MNLDPSDLTLDEVEEIEDLTGCAFDELWSAGKPKAKVLKAMVYIMQKRTNPDFTWEEAGKQKITVVQPDPKGSNA